MVRKVAIVRHLGKMQKQKRRGYGKIKKNKRQTVNFVVEFAGKS